MQFFDPWPSLDRDEAREGALTEIQRLQLAWARDLDANRPASGFEVLLAAAQCAGNRIPVPDWLAAHLLARLQRVTMLEVDSLDDPAAFGPLPQHAGQRRTAALRKKWARIVEAMFKPVGPYRRTPAGRRAAAIATEGMLTARQLLDLLPKTRSNRKGHRPYKASRSAAAASAHDPFSLIPQKGTKR